MPGTGAEREAAFAARWGASAFAGRWLRAVTGERLAVLFPGRPGGPAGPDFRDAVLLCPDGSRIYGDVEIHLRARGWRQHGHAVDRRYNHVVLHVVRHADGARVTPLASGAWAPLIELDFDAEPPATTTSGTISWPCDALAKRLPSAGVGALLRAAGTARLVERAAEFERALRQASADSPSPSGWSTADGQLFVALAEGMAYGRDREPLRAAGTWLARGNAPDGLLPELARLPALDAKRLAGLLALHDRWSASGPWRPLRRALERGTERDATRTLIDTLAVAGGHVSPGRAAILVANVVLPFALAMAALAGDDPLATRAQALFLALPGLPSNQITRTMQRQIGLARAPAGACAQQGLQHVWAHYCREKHCDLCPCGQLTPLPRGSERQVHEPLAAPGAQRQSIYWCHEYSIR